LGGKKGNNCRRGHAAGGKRRGGFKISWETRGPGLKRLFTPQKPYVEKLCRKPGEENKTPGSWGNASYGRVEKICRKNLKVHDGPMKKKGGHNAFGARIGEKTLAKLRR